MNTIQETIVRKIYPVILIASLAMILVVFSVFLWNKEKNERQLTDLITGSMGF